MLQSLILSILLQSSFTLTPHQGTYCSILSINKSTTFRDVISPLSNAIQSNSVLATRAINIYSLIFEYCFLPPLFSMLPQLSIAHPNNFLLALSIVFIINLIFFDSVTNSNPPFQTPGTSF